LGLERFRKDIYFPCALPFLHFDKYFNGLYAKHVMRPSNAVELESLLVRSILGTLK